MSEPIFNLFLIIDDDQVIVELGVSVHQFSGSDAEMMSYLQEHVQSDMTTFSTRPIPSNYKVFDPNTGETKNGIASQRWAALCENGEHLSVFEDIFAEFGAPHDPLTCITPICRSGEAFEMIGAQDAPAHPVDVREIHLKFIKENYFGFASFAWRAFEEKGRGAIIIGVHSEPIFLSAAEMATADLHSDLRGLVQEYLPSEEFVVAIVRADGEDSFYRIKDSNFPPPVVAAQGTQ